MLKKIFGTIKLMHQRSKEGHLSVFRQCREIFNLWRTNGIGPGYYVKANLWHRDMKWEDKLDYLSEPLYWKKMRERNPQPYHMITRNKLPDKALRLIYNIPTSEYLGVFHKTRGRRAKGGALCTIEQFGIVIRDNNFQRFCVKPLEGFGGAGFLALDCREQSGGIECKILGQEKWLSLDRLCQEYIPDFNGEGVILENYVDQHEWYHSVNPSSVNTLRIYVVWYDDRDEPEVIGGIFRFGRSGTIVDNTDAGGLFVGIDSGTGVLGSIRSKHGFTTSEGSIHPDTGVRIEGVKLPMWEESKALTLDAMKCIPGMRAIGFDVAITKDGPVILEANERTSYQGLATTGLPPGRFVRATSR